MRSKNKKATPWHGCPIRFALGIWGDKWTLLIIRDLIFRGKRYYSEFTEPEESIATNILADRLKKLEENGIITKAKDPNNKSKFIYGLTEKGKALLPIMLEIVDWAEKYDEKTEVPKEFIKQLRKDRKKFAAQLKSKLDTLTHK